MFSKTIAATLLAVAAADANGSHLVNDDVDVVTERSCPAERPCPETPKNVLKKKQPKYIWGWLVPRK
jgi:hypothetical protein